MIAIILSEVQKPDAGVTALIISAVIAAIGILIIFLFTRFVRSYDDRIKGLHTLNKELKQALEAKESESIARDNKIHERIDEAIDEINAIKETISKNIAERERQIAEVDRKAYDNRILTMQQFEKVNIILARLKERILKGWTSDEE